MTKLQQSEIVSDLCANISNEILAKIQAGKIPDNWDGFELRQLVADKAQAVSYHKSMTDKRSARRREYDKVYVNNNL